MRQPQCVGIDYNAKCNAKCLHCCVGSSPQASAKIDAEKVDQILNDLIKHPDVCEVGFTGGEPFLEKRQLLTWLKRCADNGMKTNVTTNGYWGITRKSADNVFRELEETNLSSLTISYDDFHAKFVSIERIKNVLEASKISRIPTILNVCVSKTHISDQLLSELGSAVFGIKVTKFPVQPCGTGKNIPDEAVYRFPLESLPSHCPGFELIYYNDGNVYPCCSPPIFDTKMHLGAIGVTDHEGFVQRLERNELLAAIQKLGFKWLVEQIKEVNPEAEVANLTEAVSICEVCSKILADHKSLNLIRDRIHNGLKALNA